MVNVAVVIGARRLRVWDDHARTRFGGGSGTACGVQRSTRPGSEFEFFYRLVRA